MAFFIIIIMINNTVFFYVWAANLNNATVSLYICSSALVPLGIRPVIAISAKGDLYSRLVFSPQGRSGLTTVYSEPVQVKNG